MKVSEKIKNVSLENEFRICSKCGYEMGFHISFLRNGEGHNHSIVLICPNCGARFNVGWRATL